ncbi:MAG TPA: hypothetical protein P5295_07415 [Spirochaetota bacterium]|nr:hypothetical protein [Spirochaetota bacterium]
MLIRRPNRDNDDPLDSLPIQSIDDLDVDVLDPDGAEDMADGTVFHDGEDGPDSAAKIASAGEEGFSAMTEDISVTDEMTVMPDTFSDLAQAGADLAQDSDMTEFTDDDLCEGEDDPEDGSSSEDGEELPDPLGDEVRQRRRPLAGPRVCIVDRKARSLTFSSSVDFIRACREQIRHEIELYE